MGKGKLVIVFLAALLADGGSLPLSLLAAEAPVDLFNDLCSICHGAGGRGDGPSAAGLHPRPADFADCTVMADRTDDALSRIIKGGGQSVGRSTVMPSWGDSLNAQQISDLVAFIRGFCKR